jgi:hypothetical protein
MSWVHHFWTYSRQLFDHALKSIQSFKIWYAFKNR